MAEGTLRPAWAEVDLEALERNVVTLGQLVAPSRVCAVVKANAYGHGAVEVARAALTAGTAWLAVALVEEGLELRAAGIQAPVLLLSEPGPGGWEPALAAGLTPTVYRAEGVAAAEAAARAAGRRDVRVHVKVDTGMHRVGADPDQVVDLSLAVAASDRLSLEGLWTHFAVADEPGDPFTRQQLARFEEVRGRLADAGIRPPLVHTANSAGGLAHPASRYDMVRFGIALYGYVPCEVVPPVELRPVLSLRARVSLVRELAAGERVSYGRRRPLPCRGWVATVPIGYADGVPRRLVDGAMEVLVGGRRRPFAGTVTMDQVLVDCGPEPGVAVGDEVVLLGAQGSQRIGADDWARALGTISYEVLCGIGARVPRVMVRSQSEGTARGGAGAPPSGGGRGWGPGRGGEAADRKE